MLLIEFKISYSIIVKNINFVPRLLLSTFINTLLDKVYYKCIIKLLCHHKTTQFIFNKLQPIKMKNKLC